MIFTGVTVAQVEEIIAEVNKLPQYQGNLCGEWQRYPNRSVTRLSANRWRGRLMVQDSAGPGARRSWSGRHMPAACWHAFRDVIALILARYPAARVSTSMARYTADNWESTYPATGRRNVGSMMQPITMRELCDCES